MKQHRQNLHESIAIVAPAIAREGITKQVANQIIGLQQKQVNVCLIVLAQSNVGVLEDYGVGLATLSILQLHQSTAYLSPRAFAGSTLIVWPILRFLKEHKAISVIAHAPYAQFVMRLAKLVAPVFGLAFNLIQYFHGLQYSEYPVNTWRRYAVNSMNKSLARRCDDAHVSVSKIVQQEVMQHLVRIPIHVVLYNSITDSTPGRVKWNATEEMAWQRVQPTLQQARKKYQILLPNRIDYNKGQLFFLEVAEAFLSTKDVRATDIVIFVVGDGSQKQEVEEMVQQKRLEDSVLLLGELPNAVVQQLMQEVNLVVVPSFKEGLPFTVLEALRAKCVILASDTGGIPEIIKDHKTGFLFEAGNITDCLRQLLYIYSHRHGVLIDEKAIDEVLQNKYSLRNNTEELLHIVSTTHTHTTK